MPVVLTEIFSNKLVESYRYREKTLFEHLDFGNYFFSGYPRPRWGIEEYPKLFIVFLPLLILGILRSEKVKLLYLVELFLFYCLLLSAVGLRDPTWGLPLTLIVIPLTGWGFLEIENSKNFKIWLVLVIGVFFLEFAYFFNSYRLGLTESRFSKRNVVYEQLTRKILNLSVGYEKIYVSDRLDNPKLYFDFYTPEIKNKLVYGSFEVKKDSTPDSLFVGVLPFEPSPSEPLYKEDGNWPEYITVFDDIKDAKHNQDIVVFSSHL
jgi:hypothetical protein